MTARASANNRFRMQGGSRLQRRVCHGPDSRTVCFQPTGANEQKDECLTEECYDLIATAEFEWQNGSSPTSQKSPNKDAPAASER